MCYVLFAACRATGARHTKHRQQTTATRAVAALTAIMISIKITPFLLLLLLCVFVQVDLYGFSLAPEGERCGKSLDVVDLDVAFPAHYRTGVDFLNVSIFIEHVMLLFSVVQCRPTKHIRRRAKRTQSGSNLRNSINARQSANTTRGTQCSRHPSHTRRV